MSAPRGSYEASPGVGVDGIAPTSAAVVGIDLGTTISLLAHADQDGRVTTAGTRDGGPRLQSVVHVASDGRSTVGAAAERLAPLEAPKGATPPWMT
jgi:molecular chaperone DnaK (HSP70)